MFGAPIMTLQVRSCRVWAADEEGARQAVDALLVKEGLTPVQPPKPRRLAVEQQGLVWWQCTALCEG